jgi:SSS family solute:Na+ symporter
MVTVSGLLTQNLYKPLFPNRPDDHYVKVGRVLGAVYLIGAVFIAFNASNIFRMMKFMLFITIACGPAMLMGFLWRRTNAKGVWVSMGVSLVITLFIPMMMSVPQARENSKLLLEIITPEVHKTYTASERDVHSRKADIEKWNLLNAKGLAKGECPAALAVGDKFTKTYLPAPRAVFWDQNIKKRKDGTRYGDGLFKTELYMMHLCGFNFSKFTPSQVEAISISIKLIFPFLAVILIGMFTKPVPDDVLDRFYIKLRTPVNEDHDQDARDVSENQAHPERTEHVRLFPNSNWEFQKQPRYDVIGMSVATATGILLTIAIYFIAKIGA